MWSSNLINFNSTSLLVIHLFDDAILSVNVFDFLKENLFLFFLV